MRNILAIGITCIFLYSCNKDKFTSVPQIKYKSVSPNAWLNAITPPGAGPVLTIHLTDAEGDFGFEDNKDSAWVYVKNMTIPPFNTDSFKFPNLGSSGGKNLEADIDIVITDALESSSTPGPHTDTLFFEVYVKDFAKNKSNVILTGDPVYFITQ